MYIEIVVLFLRKLNLRRKAPIFITMLIMKKKTLFREPVIYFCVIFFTLFVYLKKKEYEWNGKIENNVM